MEFYFFKMAVAIIVVIVTWISCTVIIKWIWTLMKRQFSYMVDKSQDNQLLDASASLPSSSSVGQCKHDVFLSFRGVDTRKGIAFELYDGLQSRRGIKTFMDAQDLQVGDVISPTLLTAIEESRFAIVVLSPNYASSTWCLEELRNICECMEDNNRILPLFYNVDPNDIRYQKRSFGDAFTKHEKSGRHRAEKVQQWRDACKKVANFSGWHMQNFQSERELVKEIVECMYSKVQPIEINTGDFDAFGATREAMDEVMNVLKDDEISVIGVYGMGGVGKTTMGKHVCAQACENGTFHQVIMAVVSQSPDLKKIQETLADLLGVKLEERTDLGRAGRLNKEIVKREKILIILDDIWEMIDLSSIGVPSNDKLKKCNSKVLFTTRRLYVCHSMESQASIPLNILSEEDSWKLFVKKARRSFEKSTHFYDIARKVARECCGLPIALIAVARALGNKDLVEWKKAAQRLENSQTANLDDKGDAFECIKLSYDYLKDEDCKLCFLLCCLSPEDYDIPIEDLFKRAIGKGLFRDANTIREARGTADSVVKYLKDSSLLMDGRNNNSVRMHDVIRDTAMKIAKSEDGHAFLVKAGCGLGDWPRHLHEGYSVVSLMQNHIRKLPEQLVFPKLQILLLNNNFSIEKIPEKFFQCPNELRLLDLSETGISSLPQSFSLLTNLQALYLDGCQTLVDISILGKLKKLEILSMRNYCSNELSIEIGDMTNLKMLDITGGHIARIPSKVISNLNRLEELYLQCGFWEWGSKVEGEGEQTNVGFDEVTSLSNLRGLRVWISDEECIPKHVEFNPNWLEIDICIGRYEKTEASGRFGHNSIFLQLDTISSLPDWFCNAVMNIAERLSWEGCQKLNEIFVEYEHGRLHGLKHLSVHGRNENLEELMNRITSVPKEPVFENLEELELCFLDCMESFVGELPPGSLFNLKLLKVTCCYKWGNVLLPSKSSQILPNLEQLHCCFMEGIEYVFGYEALFEPKQSKLREIGLSYLAAARSICNGPAPPAMFQTLERLFINCCNFQGSLFTSDVAECLSQLKYFDLLHCPFLERIVEASNKKIILPNLYKLTLRELQMLSYESATFDIECPSLQYLNVWDCPQFSVYVSDFHSRKQVQFYPCGPFHH